MVSALSADQVEAYRRDGFLCPVPVFSTEEIAAIRSDFEAVEAKAGRTIGEMPGFVRAKTHLLYPWMDALVRHPRLLDVVEGLVGGNILVYHLTCWVKEPGDGRFVSWHQDGTYFSLEPYEHVTAWIPLSPATVETGCMMAIPGSHTIGQRDHTTEKSDRNLLSNGQTIAARIDEDKAVPLEVPVGSISLHHTHLVHASNPNRGSDRRIGIGVSYIPTHVRFTGEGRVGASLVRGKDTFGHFDHDPAPLEDAPEAAAAVHKEAVRRFFASHGSRRTDAA